MTEGQIEVQFGFLRYLIRINTAANRVGRGEPWCPPQLALSHYRAYGPRTRRFTKKRSFDEPGGSSP